MNVPYVYDVEQGSEEWAQLRCGKITTSRAKDAFDVTTKGEYKSERGKYLSELVCERLTGIPYLHYVTKEMEWGRAQEPFARQAYELDAAVFVDQVGFVIHPEIEFFGCSPDGLVGDDGMIQIKCPTTLAHLDCLRSGVIPLEHTFQMTAELACTGRKWCDFVSYDPRLPEHLQLFVRRYARHEKSIVSMEAEVRHFNQEIEANLKSLPPGPQLAAQVLDWPKEEDTL